MKPSTIFLAATLATGTATLAAAPGEQPDIPDFVAEFAEHVHNNPRDTYEGFLNNRLVEALKDENADAETNALLDLGARPPGNAISQAIISKFPDGTISRLIEASGPRIDTPALLTALKEGRAAIADRLINGGRMDDPATMTDPFWGDPFSAAAASGDAATLDVISRYVEPRQYGSNLPFANDHAILTMALENFKDDYNERQIVDPGNVIKAIVITNRLGLDLTLPKRPDEPQTSADALGTDIDLIIAETNDEAMKAAAREIKEYLEASAGGWLEQLIARKEQRTRDIREINEAYGTSWDVRDVPCAGYGNYTNVETLSHPLTDILAAAQVSRDLTALGIRMANGCMETGEQGNRPVITVPAGSFLSASSDRPEAFANAMRAIAPFLDRGAPDKRPRGPVTSAIPATVSAGPG
ncbi:MAG: hypothetical protein EOM26_08595 [Alphaproteobacteria bacterium]|nr:hypothetical protein [Alphaproteobacteria bacterium]